MAPFITALPAHWAHMAVAIPFTACADADCWRRVSWRLATLGPGATFLSLIAGLLALAAWCIAPAVLRTLEPPAADDLPPLFTWLRLSTALAVVAAALVFTQSVGAPTRAEYLESLPIIARLEAEAPPHGPPATATVLLDAQSTSRRPTVEYTPPANGAPGSVSLLLDDRPHLHSALYVREMPLVVREDVVGGFLYFCSGGSVFGVRSSDLTSKLVSHRHLISRLRPAMSWRVASAAGLAVAGLLQLAWRRAARRARAMHIDAPAPVYRQAARARPQDVAPPPWLATLDAWTIAVLAASSPPVFTTWLMVQGMWG
ncbi:MAG: hypothetical protein WKG00_41115 [Polyangiaceae bacterium]